MSDFWRNRNVTLTGGMGFLGRHLFSRLQAAGASVFAPTHLLCDLTTPNGVESMFLTQRKVDVLFHLAAVVGGIGANARAPADFYYANTLMNTLVLEGARQAKVGKLVAVGSVCAYPKFAPVPFREANLWLGCPEETNAAYGISKRGLLAHCQALRQQYGFKAIYLIPTNLYGPGDNFNPDTSHVIPALIRKFVEAREADLSEVEVWGSGQATRDFLYVEDCANALLLAAEHYDSPEPVNLGTAVETSIQTLANQLRQLTAFNGVVKWNQAKPDGQPWRVLDTTRAREGFGWRATTPLKLGLQKTLDWYMENEWQK